MRYVILAVLLSCTAFGQTRSGMRSASIGNRVIEAGDSVEKVLSAGDDPVNKVTLTNEYGVKIGEEWEFRRNNSSVFVTIGKNGKVLKVESYTN